MVPFNEWVGEQEHHGGEHDAGGGQRESEADRLAGRRTAMLCAAAWSAPFLGSWIGDARKTVGRALADLRGLGVVKTHLRGHVGITSPDRLFEFAETADAGRPAFGASSSGPSRARIGS